MLDQGYGIMPNRVLFDDELSSTAKLVFCYLSSLTAERGFAWASNKHIADKFGMKIRMVSTIIGELEKAGYIESFINTQAGNKREITIAEIRDTYSNKLHEVEQKNAIPIAKKDGTNNITNIKLQDNSTNLKYGERDVELSTLLLDLVHGNYAFIDKKPTEKDYIEMNRLHRLDGWDADDGYHEMPYEVIEAAIKWSQKNDFWRQNCQSVPTLRKQFKKLLVRMKSESVAEAGRVATI